MKSLHAPQWTDEQLSVLETHGVGLAVMAGAGAGKTTVLVEKCARLLSSNPEARICAVSFTEKSAGDLRVKLSRFDLTHHWVTTIHGLCGLLIREYPELADLQGDERVLSEVETSALWEKALEELWFDPRDPGDPELAPLQRLLAREGKKGLEGLLVRCRDLETAGILEVEVAEQGDLTDLLQVARQVLLRFKQLKAESAVLDFADLEKGALQILRDARARDNLRRRFDLLLVDEFQDTNPIQAEILWSLAREDRSNLCVVGDPKQSIYRFRDADVGLFEELCARLPKRLSLTRNFRSRPGVLHFVNRICAPLFEASDLRYEPLVPGREEFTKDSNVDSVRRLSVSGPEDFARFLKSENAQGVPWDQMAILMRRVRGSERWIQALSRAGIPVSVGGGGLFWSDPRVLECVALLEWWASPAYELSALSFLRAPWSGVSDEQIDSWRRGSSEGLSRFWKSDLPVAQALRSFREGHTGVRRENRPAELLQVLLADPACAEALAPLRQSVLTLIHRLEELSYKGMSFSECVVQLRKLIDDGKREKEIPPPRNRGVLPILTIHASKGLEFERVYLTDFGKKPRAHRLPLLFWDRHHGAYLTGRDELGEKLEREPAFMDWKVREQGASLAESKRQFYVALTRARDHLTLVCEHLEDPKGIEPDPEKAASSEHWRSWLEHFGGDIFSSDSLEAQPISGLDSDELKQEVHHIVLNPRQSQMMERSRHAVTEWALLARCPRAYVRSVLGFTPETASAVLLGEEDRDAWVEPASGLSAIELGKKVHALLEKWALFPAERDEISVRIHELEQMTGSRRFSARHLLDWLERTQWLDLSGISEWPFEWRLKDVALVGAIDRLVETPEGWVVIDFKIFSRIKESGVLQELYRPQLELYSAALSAALSSQCQKQQVQKPRIRALLIQITPEGVSEEGLELSAANLESQAADLAQLSRTLVQSPEIGEQSPRPQSSCRYCPHQDRCSESSRM